VISHKIQPEEFERDDEHLKNDEEDEDRRSTGNDKHHIKHPMSGQCHQGNRIMFSRGRDRYHGMAWSGERPPRRLSPSTLIRGAARDTAMDTMDPMYSLYLNDGDCYQLHPTADVHRHQSSGFEIGQMASAGGHAVSASLGMYHGVVPSDGMMTMNRILADQTLLDAINIPLPPQTATCAQEDNRVNDDNGVMPPSSRKLPRITIPCPQQDESQYNQVFHDQRVDHRPFETAPSPESPDTPYVSNPEGGVHDSEIEDEGSPLSMAGLTPPFPPALALESPMDFGGSDPAALYHAATHLNGYPLSGMSPNDEDADGVRVW